MFIHFNDAARIVMRLVLSTALMTVTTINSARIGGDALDLALFLLAVAGLFQAVRNTPASPDGL